MTLSRGNENQVMRAETAAAAFREKQKRPPSAAELGELIGLGEKATLMLLASWSRMHLIGCKDGEKRIRAAVEAAGEPPTIYQLSCQLNMPYIWVLVIVLALPLAGKVTLTSDKLSVARGRAADYVRKTGDNLPVSAIAKHIGQAHATMRAILAGSDIPHRTPKWTSRADAVDKALAMAAEKPGHYTISELGKAVSLSRNYVYSRFAILDKLDLIRYERERRARSCKQPAWAKPEPAKQAPKPPKPPKAPKKDRVRKPRRSVLEILDSKPKLMVVDKTDIKPAANTFNQLLSKGW